MFSLQYCIAPRDYDDFYGQNGFFEIHCNDKKYGELYSEETRQHLIPESLYDWFDRLVSVAIHFFLHDMVYLSDTECATLWLEFKRNGDKLHVSLIDSDKSATGAIEFALTGQRKVNNWEGEEISFAQFLQEITTKVNAFVDEILTKEPMQKEALELRAKLRFLQ